MHTGEDRARLLEALAAQAPPVPPQRPQSELDDFEVPPDEPDGPINTELRRLLRGLQVDPIDEWVVMTAIGRLRHLYRQRRRDYSEILKIPLRQIAEALPFLQDSPEFVRQGPECYARVGGPDNRAERGYPPQHRSRF